MEGGVLKGCTVGEFTCKYFKDYWNGNEREAYQSKQNYVGPRLWQLLLY